MTDYSKGLESTKEVEKDERWTAVDKWALNHLYPVQSRLHEHISYAMQLAESNYMPDIAVSLLQGKFLMTQIQMVDAKHVLEVGTLGGASSNFLLPPR